MNCHAVTVRLVDGLDLRHAPTGQHTAVRVLNLDDLALHRERGAVLGDDATAKRYVRMAAGQRFTIRGRSVRSFAPLLPPSSDQGSLGSPTAVTLASVSAG